MQAFPVIPTDNGPEFANPRALVFDRYGNRHTRIFYCDPYAAFQKPFVEVSHTLIRRIIPKGKSFDASDQLSTQRIVNHINSYVRDKLNRRSAYEAFSLLFGQDLPERLNANFVPPNDIVLRPDLLTQ